MNHPLVLIVQNGIYFEWVKLDDGTRSPENHISLLPDSVRTEQKLPLFPDEVFQHREPVFQNGPTVLAPRLHPIGDEYKSVDLRRELIAIHEIDVEANQRKDFDRLLGEGL